jgi:threonine dehydrogenase-like Zn-dependent dehydrogenase
MKALVFTDIRQMTYKDVHDPEVGHDEVLIDVKAVGFCGSELESFVGHSRRRRPPLIMGHEFSGVIADVGKDVTGLSIGQRVVANPLISCGYCKYCQRGLTNACPNRLLHSSQLPGAFADYIAIKRKAVFPIPDNLSDYRAAMVEPLANGIHVNSLVGERFPENVVIFGAGAIGLVCLQTAMFAGAMKTVVVDVSPGRLKVAREIGADEVINAREVGVVSTVKNRIGGSDLCIDAVGRKVTRQQALEFANPGSYVVYIGIADTFGEINGHDIILKELKVLGSYGYNNRDFEKAIKMMESGRIRVDEWIRTAPLSDGHVAVNRVIDDPDNWIKLILEP